MNVPSSPRQSDEPHSLPYATALERPPGRLAIASAVLGSIGLPSVIWTPGDILPFLVGVLCSGLACLLGYVAVRRAAKTTQRYGGRSLALAGIALGIAGLGVAGYIVAQIPGNIRRTVLYSAMRGIEIHGANYAREHDGVFPADINTLIEAGRLHDYTLQNPWDDNPRNTCDFFYVSGLRLDDPPTWILAYTTNADGRGKSAAILHLDGSIKFQELRNFEQELQQFRAAFEADRGRPPNIIGPH